MTGASDPTIWIDGERVPPERAVVSVLDRGLLYGDGVFEVLRTWRGVAVDLDAHLARLASTAAALQLPISPDLRAWVTRAIAGLPSDVRARIVVTRGPGALRERFGDLGRGDRSSRGRAIVIVEPLADPPRSVTLAVVDLPVAPRAGHKTLAYLDHLVARELAAAAGADDAIRLDARGDVAECATANLFAVIGGAVATPQTDGGALPGIVRARVLASCTRLSIPVAARRISLSEIRGADELFVTSSLRGVVPVTALDGESRPAGPLTARLAEDYVVEMSALAVSSRDRATL